MMLIKNDPAINNDEERKLILVINIGDQNIINYVLIEDLEEIDEVCYNYVEGLNGL